MYYRQDLALVLILPLFKRRALTYIQWTPTTNDSALDLHYQSLNIRPPLKINKTILNALDQTFHRIDGNIITKLQKVRQDIDSIHETTSTSTALIVASVALCVATINVIILITLCCYQRRARREPNNMSLVHYVKDKHQPQDQEQEQAHQPLNTSSCCPDCGSALDDAPEDNETQLQLQVDS